MWAYNPNSENVHDCTKIKEKKRYSINEISKYKNNFDKFKNFVYRKNRKLYEVNKKDIINEDILSKMTLSIKKNLMNVMKNTGCLQ